MKEQAIKRINKMGKAGDIIINICKAFVMIGIVAALTGGILCSLLPKDLISMQFSGDAKIAIDMDAAQQMAGKTFSDQDMMDKVISSGTLSVDGKEFAMGDIAVEDNELVINAKAETPRTIGLGSLTGVWLSALLLSVAGLVTLIFAGKLCKAFRDCESPFAENVIRKMQYLAYSLIPWVVINSIAEGIVTFSLGRTDKISFNMDISTIMVVLVVFALVYVFKYGALLQQESDETL